MLLRPIELVILLIGIFLFAYPALNNAAPPQLKPGEDASRFVLHYVEALSHSRIEGWASADLGCLSLARATTDKQSSQLAPEMARRCWDDTLHGHIEMVTQQAESGVFNATGRGIGLGLLADRHRATENWKDYPPAVFVSPPIILNQHAPTPQTTIRRISPAQSFALSNIKKDSLVSVSGQAVDIQILYPDPFTAPLALRPEEIWWVNGSQRQFGPVREVTARFIVVTGLRKFGFSADRAVMNEVLPGTPLIATTHYGLHPDNGRKFDRVNPAQPFVKGELVPGSTQWWKRTEAEPLIQAALDRAPHLSSTERGELLTRLLLIDPNHTDAHLLRGEDAYQAFLKQGIVKGGLAANDGEALKRIAELYWTIQAQTWRQELTAVAEGYEPAADALYRSLASYEALGQLRQATSEQRRRLGVLTRWNNDPTGALSIHEALLRDTTSGTAEYARILTEIAWDRIQFVSWNRRYDHPWLQQAHAEAEQAVELLMQPYDMLHAHYALVAVESLSVPRNLDQFQQQMRQVKQDLDQISGVKGLQGQLVANDLVKSLTADATTIVLPSPPRSREVLDVAVHANPPKQDIIWQWNFDQEQLGHPPTGFVILGRQGEQADGWQVQADQTIPNEAQRLVHASACETENCLRVLVATKVRTTYPDVTVQVRTPNSTDQGELGLAVAITDPANYYAITLQPGTGQVTTRRIVNDRVTILGQATAKLAPKSWHTIRVQRINFLHLDKGRLAVYIDGAQIAAVDDAILPQDGQVGFIALGPGEAEFAGLHVLDLVSNRTFSKPAAY
ncbi:MAG: hypothetical protein CCU26_04945 [Nitrospira sp. UW-LDO-01]|nr:hypothetical protein [Nitrospira sp.]OYT20771.1 MAG: hypothetical protein CCU26_04945 [Nitrospira sp. UW-LDO-01]